MTNIIHVPVGKDLPPFAADVDRLPADIMFRLATTVGLKNKLLDARAACYPTRRTKDGGTEPNPDYSPENAMAMVQKVWDNLVRGEWGRERSASVNLSPVEARIERLARAGVIALLKAKGHKVKDVPEAKMAEFVKAYKEKYGETLFAEAERQIEAETRLQSMPVDLEDLGL